MMHDLPILDELRLRFGKDSAQIEETRDDIPTISTNKASVLPLLHFLKEDTEQPYRMLFDMTAIDERNRTTRPMDASNEFTAVYTLFSFDRNQDLRVKVPLASDDLLLPSITSIWPSANWYEREIWDMFGIRFNGHPYLRRLLMPKSWEGHPLRKDHPARATEMTPYELEEEDEQTEQDLLKFSPEEWGMQRTHDQVEYMFLNLGPAHTGTHGILRLVVQLAGEQIVDIVPDIGFHHRAAEKMGERQTWHTYIPYTDRIDYLGGVMNELPYLLAVERLAGIRVPARAQVIRVMLAELFRIASHLVWYGTFAQDVGQLSPVFYMFTDRERVFHIIEAITGGRMHPGWFRIGGVAHDLPQGWEHLVREFLEYLPPRLNEYDDLVLGNRIFQARTKGVGRYTTQEAMDWGVTGPGLRATGFSWDFRKTQPYSGYEQFDFEVPTAANGDCYDRGLVRVEEMRQSLRIIEQCLNQMPEGPTKADHALTTPPDKARTLHDIETLIQHFLAVSWGPRIPAGEVMAKVEATKGCNAYYLISDGAPWPYRVRIRTPSFPHIQMVPSISKGHLLSDLLAILGSVDFVLADVDR
ncbi:MAG: NADH-quinone oxidoreductase subunit C/D [Nitrospira sp.]|nr:NADH-quinone oxidoreductase subunit C/D [Nitrospira sp.]